MHRSNREVVGSRPDPFARLADLVWSADTLVEAVNAANSNGSAVNRMAVRRILIALAYSTRKAEGPPCRRGCR